MFELSREIMAGLALAVFWIHALLIAAAAGQDLRALARLRRALARLPSAAAGLRDGAVGLLEVTIREGAGPDDALARNVLEQVGRGKGDGKVHFSDSARRSEVFGGLVELDDGTQLRVEAGEGAVWPEAGERSCAAARAPELEFAAVEAQARRAKGYRREVQCELGPGRRAWIAGRLREAGGWTVEPAIPPVGAGVGRGVAGEPVLLIAAIEPRRWLARRCWLIVAFIVAELALAAGCTVVALWPPLFGWVSMVGAAAALGFFLGVQPLGVTLNEASRPPDRAYLRGTWTAP